MLYALMGEDAPNSLEKRGSARNAHLARLQQLQNEGRLILAGPFPAVDAPVISAGCTGSLIVAEFSSLADAQIWADNDPYVAAGIYKNLLVRPFKQVLPA